MRYGFKPMILGVLFATAAAAQDIPWSAEATEACLSEATDAGACIGVSAGACIDTPDGYTTVGMGYCLGREADYWDGRLNNAYRALMVIERAQDAEMKELGSRAPSMADALRDMQRAWIAWRDAACVYEVSQWGGGTGGGPAYQQCRMEITGAQALALEDRLARKVAQ